MHTTHLRQVGGSVMLAIPKALLEVLQLEVGKSVGLALEEGRLVMSAAPKRRYSLDDLLAQCDSAAEMSAEDREWLEAPTVGKELL